MTLPLFVFEGDDVHCFQTLSTAAGHFEGPDVLAGVFQGFDADGFALAFASDGGRHDYSARVRIQRAGAAPAIPAHSALLRRWLAARGHVSATDLTWPQLVQTASEHLAGRR